MLASACIASPKVAAALAEHYDVEAIVPFSR
jgi:hypothetical protein